MKIDSTFAAKLRGRINVRHKWTVIFASLFPRKLGGLISSQIPYLQVVGNLTRRAGFQRRIPHTMGRFRQGYFSPQNPVEVNGCLVLNPTPTNIYLHDHTLECFRCHREATATRTIHEETSHTPGTGVSPLGEENQACNIPGRGT